MQTSRSLAPGSARPSLIDYSGGVSAIASCYVVSSSVPAQLVADPGEWKRLLTSAHKLDYPWSGYVIATLVPYLDEHGVDLGGSELAMPLTNASGMSCIVLTHDHQRFLDKLDPASHDRGALRAYYEEFTGAPADGVDDAMVDGIRFLRDAITALTDHTIGLVVIG